MLVRRADQLQYGIYQWHLLQLVLWSECAATLVDVPYRSEQFHLFYERLAGEPELIVDSDKFDSM